MRGRSQYEEDIMRRSSEITHTHTRTRTIERAVSVTSAKTGKRHKHNTQLHLEAASK